MKCFLLILLLAFLAGIGADVVNLTDADFDSYVDGSTNVLVEFYAPWCGHCKNLAPEWKIAGETFQSSDPIVIAAVDATANSKVAAKYEVKGYPTIKFFPKGDSVTVEDYTGGRTADSIIKWVNDKVGTTRKLKAVPSAVTALTTADFDAVALGPKAALVEFYAPWCGHCKELAPKYEALAKAFAGDKDVVIAKVDATEERELADKYDISGFPTIKFFPANSADPEPYEQARDLESMVKFINEKAGTMRNPDGSLMPEAGRVPALEDLISAAEAFDAKLVETLKAAVSSLSGTEAKYGSQYVATAEKIVAKGEEYVAKEIKRLAGMIASPSVVPEMKTNFQLRQNVLQAFVKA